MVVFVAVNATDTTAECCVLLTDTTSTLFHIVWIVLDIAVESDTVWNDSHKNSFAICSSGWSAQILWLTEQQQIGSHNVANEAKQIPFR